ncbi:MAG TPA: hypothetical protein VM308_07460 [Sphingomicrobium sp.]|nr:hypothetical protein [Sphingomicrobium sp.]
MTVPASAVPSAANDPNRPNHADMQAICDAKYVDTQSDPSVWRAKVRDASSTATTPTAVEGSEEEVNHRADTSDPNAWSYVGFLGSGGQLSRTGGSPNLWAFATFDHSEWDNTLYDVQMNFTHDVTYTWTCEVEERVANENNGGNGGGNQGCGAGGEAVQDEITVGGGNHTCGSNGQGGGNGQSGGNGQGGGPGDGGNGQGNNGCGLGNGGSNGTNENCGGNGGNNGGRWEYRASYDEELTNEDIDDGTDITETGVFLAGHVEGVDYLKDTGPLYTNVRILSCISPGSKGGAWKPKAYYQGPTACSTTAFNQAPTLSGRSFDNPPTNSLPAN